MQNISVQLIYYYAQDGIKNGLAAAGQPLLAIGGGAGAISAVDEGLGSPQTVRMDTLSIKCTENTEKGSPRPHCVHFSIIIIILLNYLEVF